ncbi:MFS transporter [Streptacidiphilus monticola]
MGYLSVLRSPQVARLLSGTLTGRLPAGMTAIAIALALRAAGAGYALVGLTSAAYAVSAAVGGPVLGRLVDRLGQPRVLLGSAVVASLGYVLLALAPAPRPWHWRARRWPGCACRRWSRACARCGRTSSPSRSWRPPTHSTRRASRSCTWPGRCSWPGSLPSAPRDRAVARGRIRTGRDSRRRHRACGPDVAGARARGWGRRGRPGTWLARAAALARAGTAAARLRGHGLVGGRPEHPLRRLRAGPALLPGGGGTLLALAALAGLLGALAYGAVRWTAPTATRTWAMAAGMAVSYLPLLALPGPLGMAGAAALSGLGLAPLLAAAFLLIAELAPEGTVTEAFAWLVTLFSTGTALGSATAGTVVDSSLRGAALVACGGIVLAAVLLFAARGCWLASRRRPRGWATPGAGSRPRPQRRCNPRRKLPAEPPNPPGTGTRQAERMPALLG